tara:strand:+ start:1007 stop:2686 length:1680 start_codon:yes stop_codon:yes gene_type:complete
MPVITGSGGTGTEGKSDRIGLPTGTSDPGSPAVGDMYFKTDTKKVRMYDGTQWYDLGEIPAPDGASAATAAKSAAQLLHDYPNKGNGLYWLKNGNMGNAIQVWCDMERGGGGWMTVLNHKCDDCDGVYNDLLSGSGGTPSDRAGNWHGSSSNSYGVDNIWTQLIGNNDSSKEAQVYCREVIDGGSYDEYQFYTASTGTANQQIFSWSNFTDLFTASSGAPGNGTYETGIRVTYRNGTREAVNKQQTVWSSPSLVTINNGVTDQELYYCNGQDDGDVNWSFALMRGGTPYPRLANSANGGGRNSENRWAIYGLRSNVIADGGNVPPCDPLGDGSGIAYFPLTNAVDNGKCIGNTVWNATASGNGSFTADGYTQTDNNANTCTIPLYNDGNTNCSIGEWFQGDQDWAISMCFNVNSSASGTSHSLIHMAKNDDHARPAMWVDAADMKMEYFSSSNGSAWDIARGDTDSSGKGSTTISKGTWYHVVFTRSNSAGLKAYVNDSLDWEDSSTTNHYASGDYEIAIGNWFHNASGYGFHGSIKNVRFFRKNLSSSEVSTLYAKDL